MKRNQIIAVLIVAAGVIGWALFRPERLFVNAKVNESLPSTASTTNVAETTLATGNFHGVAHKGTGQASIYQLADGKRILRFTNFETSNGPDVHVYLVAANDATDSESVKKARLRRDWRPERQHRRPELRAAGEYRSDQIPRGHHLVPAVCGKFRYRTFVRQCAKLSRVCPDAAERQVSRCRPQGSWPSRHFPAD